MSQQRRRLMQQETSEQQVDFTSALSLALQHPAVSSDPKNICTLLQVCKSWRAAVQQSTAGLTEIKLSVDLAPLQLPKLAGFATWLPSHVGLVGAVNISTVEVVKRIDEHKALLRMARCMMELSMRQAASAATRQGRHLQLYSFTSDTLASADMLGALTAAAVLTRLDIGVWEDQGRCARAIGELSGLRQLKLVGRSEPLCPQSIGNLAALSQLIQLDLENVENSSSGFELPQQLHQLTVQYSMRGADPRVDLQLLTCLRRLQLSCTKPAAGAALPAQLQELSIECQVKPGVRYSALAAFDIPTLQKLRTLDLSRSFDSVEELQRLAGHSALQQVAYLSRKFTPMQEAASVWQSIPQLNSLGCNYFVASSSELERIVQQLTATTGLTNLCLGIHRSALNAAAGDGDSAPICEHLARLSQLQELRLFHARSLSTAEPVIISDAHHLTALTGLTRLQVLSDAGEFMMLDETIVVQWMLHLTNLEWFSLRPWKASWSTAPFPVIGRLSRLHHLDVRSLSVDNAQRALSCLTGLTRLTSLNGFEAAGQDALDAFWAAVKAHQ